MGRTTKVNPQVDCQIVEIKKIVHGGYGLGYPVDLESSTDCLANRGATWLVKGVLPGETVQAKLLKQSKRTVFGYSTKVIVSSMSTSVDRSRSGEKSVIFRVSPPWSALQGENPIGAFDYAHINYEGQLKVKQSVLADCVQRIGGEKLSKQVANLANSQTAWAVPPVQAEITTSTAAINHDASFSFYPAVNNSPATRQANFPVRLRADFQLLAPGRLAMVGVDSSKLIPITEFPFVTDRLQSLQIAGQSWYPLWARVLARPAAETWQTQQRGRLVKRTKRKYGPGHNKQVGRFPGPKRAQTSQFLLGKQVSAVADNGSVAPRIRIWDTALGPRVWDGKTLWAAPDRPRSIEEEIAQIEAFLTTDSATALTKVFARPTKKNNQDDSQMLPAIILQKVANYGSFLVEAEGFWQAHPKAADILAKATVDSARKTWLMAKKVLAHGESEKVSEPIKLNSKTIKIPNIMELYSGTGLLSRAILRELWDSTGCFASMEFGEATVQLARINLAEYDLGPESLRVGNLDRQLPSSWWPGKQTPDLIVLDPPRSGAKLSLISDIAQSEAKAIVYVACDVAAWARDAAELLRQGYQLASLEAFDLFPYTHHFELVSGFYRQ